MKPRVPKALRGYWLMERSTGDVVGTYRTRAEATRAMREMGPGLRVVTVKKPNPAHKSGRAQQREATRKRAAQRRVAIALAKYLKQANPGKKLAGAKVYKLKGGAVRIVPIKAVKR